MFINFSFLNLISVYTYTLKYTHLPVFKNIRTLDKFVPIFVDVSRMFFFLIKSNACSKIVQEHKKILFFYFFKIQ